LGKRNSDKQLQIFSFAFGSGILVAVGNCIPIGSHSATCELQANPSILNKIKTKTHPSDSHPLCSTTPTTLLFGECFGVSVPVKVLQFVAICCSGPPKHHPVADSYNLLQVVTVYCKTLKILKLVCPKSALPTLIPRGTNLVPSSYGENAVV
jgi:hypothetical protein